jgi:hypothetical protein
MKPKLKTITAAELIRKHDTELDYTPYGSEQTIREMLAEEPDTEWAIVEDEEKVTTYVARWVGQAGPVILSIYDAVEPGWEMEGEADETLQNMGLTESLRALWGWE